MDLTLNWRNEVEESVAALGRRPMRLPDAHFYLIKLENSNLILNLLSPLEPVVASQLNEQKLHFQKANNHLINLWEDIWTSRRIQVIQRIKSLLGLNRKVFGRNTLLKRLSQFEADQFLNRYHLQGSAKARFRLGLIYEGKILAVANFSGVRRMVRQGPNYTSAELIRFATIDGFTVVGGMTKLIKNFSLIVKPNDIMSYADRDWSLGTGYHSSGFKLDECTDAQEVYLNVDTLQRFFYHRLPIDLRKNMALLNQRDIESYLFAQGYRKIFNTGNLKYKLFL